MLRLDWNQKLSENGRSFFRAEKVPPDSSWQASHQSPFGTEKQKTPQSCCKAKRDARLYLKLDLFLFPLFFWLLCLLPPWLGGDHLDPVPLQTLQRLLLLVNSHLLVVHQERVDCKHVGASAVLWHVDQKIRLTFFLYNPAFCLNSVVEKWGHQC